MSLDIMTLTMMFMLLIIYFYHMDKIIDYIVLALILCPDILFAFIMWAIYAGTMSFTVSFNYKGEDKEIVIG